MTDHSDVPERTMVYDKVALGRLLIEAAINDETFEALNKDPKGMLRDLVDLGSYENVVFVQSDAKTKYVVLPRREFIQDRLRKGYKGYPPEYDSASPVYLDPKNEPADAYAFRVGDYSFSECGV